MCADTERQCVLTQREHKYAQVITQEMSSSFSAYFGAHHHSSSSLSSPFSAFPGARHHIIIQCLCAKNAGRKCADATVHIIIIIADVDK